MSDFVARKAPRSHVLPLSIFDFPGNGRQN
jgi:hypothetical protein